MAKDKERKLAKSLYMKNKSQKEIAGIVKAQEKTISSWAIKYGWRAERDARVNSTSTEVTNLREILSGLTEKKLENMRLVDAARKANDDDELTRLYGIQRTIADDYSKWNKRLVVIEDKNKVPFTTYLEVMEDVFKALQNYNPTLFMKTIDFQQQHLEDMSLKFSI